MRRRALLAQLGGLAGTAGLAGCLGDGDVPGETPMGTATPPPSTPTEADDPATPTTSFTVLDRSCGPAENAAGVSFDAATVTVDGVVGGRDGCDTAALASVHRAGDALEVVVAVVEEETAGAVACVQCLTDIEYALEARFTDAPPVRVRVVHETADGRLTVVEAERP